MKRGQGVTQAFALFDQSFCTVYVLPSASVVVVSTGNDGRAAPYDEERRCE
jgi:hypothetical protein